MELEVDEDAEEGLEVVMVDIVAEEEELDEEVSEVVNVDCVVGEADKEEGMTLEWTDEVDVASVDVAVGEDFEDFVVLSILVAAGSLSPVEVSIGSIVLAEVAAAVAVKGSRRLLIALSIGSRRKDISLVGSRALPMVS